MNNKRTLLALTASLGMLAFSGYTVAAQPDPIAAPPPMGFFITSVGRADGAGRAAEQGEHVFKALDVGRAAEKTRADLEPHVVHQFL